MKRSEIALIAFVSVLVIAFSFIIGNMFFGDLSEEVTKITYLNPIDSDVKVPNSDFFNADAHNPTVEVYVGNCAVDEKWDDNKLQCVKQDENDKNDENNKSDDELEDNPEKDENPELPEF